MADEQIKIRIQADAEQFKAVSAAVEKALADIGKEADITAGKIKSAGNAVKQSNMQWTNLALVIQDLPFGFRAIQNNLPALAGSMAAVTGPAYLAFSALVAAVTMFDQSLQKANKTADESMSKFNDINVEIKSMASIFSAVRQGTLSARDATRMYNEKLGDLYGTAKTVYEAEQLYTSKTEGYVKAQYYRAKADLEYEKAKEALKRKDNAYAEDQIGVLGRLATATVSFFKAGALQGISGLYKQSVTMATDLASQQVELAGYVTDKEEAEFQKRLALGEQYMSKAFQIEQQYGIKSTTYKDINDKEEEKRRKQALKDAEDYAKKQAALKIWVAKQTARFGQLEAAPKELSAKEQQDAYYKQLQDDFAAKMAFDKKTSLATIANLKTQYQQELALTGTDYKAKIDIQNAYLEKLKQGYMQGTIGLTEFNKERNALIIQQNKTVTDAAEANFKSIINIGTSIMSALGPALDMLLEKGASLGEVLGQAFKDILKKLVKVAIAAAITVAILATIGLVDWSQLGKAYGKLFASGMGFGNFDFAGAKAAQNTANYTAENATNGLNPSNSVNVNVSGKISGTDIAIASQRATSNNNVTF